MRKNIIKKVASVLLLFAIVCTVACENSDSLEVAQNYADPVSMDKLSMPAIDDVAQDAEDALGEEEQSQDEAKDIDGFIKEPTDIEEEDVQVAMTESVDGFVVESVEDDRRVEEADNAGTETESTDENTAFIKNGDDADPLGELTFNPRPVELGASFGKKVSAFQDEANNSLYSYVSDTIFVTINHGTHKSGEYYLTHVIISDPSQFRGGQSYGTFGGSRETCSDAAVRTGSILLTNGGYFSYDTGTALNCCAIINDGQIMNDVPTHGREVCLKSDGTLFTPEAGLSAQSLIDDGVIYSWSADPVLIRNYERPWYADDVYAPRTAIGMIEPCEYYIITSGTYGYEKGFYCSEMQDIFQALDCSFAANFDGGGSTTLVFRGNLINSPAYGDERAVADFLCFYE